MPDFVVTLKRSAGDLGRIEIHRCWDLVEAEAAARLWLLADEAAQIAEVWLNGQCLATIVIALPDLEGDAAGAAADGSR